MLRNTALTLMLNPYNISPNWKEKKIFIPSLESHLRQDLKESILTFKQKKIDRELERNAFQLRSCPNDSDDTLILMKKQKKLLEIRQNICNELNRLII